MSEALPAAQVAAMLREILDGRREIRLGPRSRPWIQVAVGEVSFVAGDAELVLFADSASLDHVVRLSIAGRPCGDFAAWLRRDGANPTDLLTEDERTALESRLQDTN